MGGVFFYANEGSRRSQSQFSSAEGALLAAGLELAESRLCSSFEDMRGRVESRVAGGAKAVIVGGGDGTLGSVAGLFAGSETVFGLMPLGTGNQFAREAGIPQDLTGAAQTLAQGRVARLDMGVCSGRPFLTVATVGLTTDIARGLQGKGILGKASYGPAVVSAIRKAKPFEVEIVGERETISGEMIQVVVCNGRTHAGPFLASPDATVTDGQFDVYAVKPIDVGHMIGASVLALAGKHTETEEVDWMKTDRLVLQTNPPLPVVIDGEESWFDVLEFSMRPGVLRTLVGPGLRVPQNRLDDWSWSQ